MESIREYVISIVAISFLCGLVQILFQENSHKDAVKLITGLILTVVIVKPVLNGGEVRIDRYLNEIATESRYAVHMGEETAEKKKCTYIKEALEAYISSKAESIGAEVTAEISLGASATDEPEGVVITGKISPYQKGRLIEMITNDLGIERDQQTWISQK